MGESESFRLWLLSLLYLSPTFCKSGANRFENNDHVIAASFPSYSTFPLLLNSTRQHKWDLSQYPGP
jgi:hypothetical protein